MTRRMNRILADYEKAFALLETQKTSCIELHIFYSGSLAILFKLERKSSAPHRLFLTQTSYKGDLENASRWVDGIDEAKESMEIALPIIFGPDAGGLERRAIGIFVLDDVII